jgi:hypothetical protein
MGLLSAAGEETRESFPSRTKGQLLLRDLGRALGHGSSLVLVRQQTQRDFD